MYSCEIVAQFHRHAEPEDIRGLTLKIPTEKPGAFGVKTGKVFHDAHRRKYILNFDTFCFLY